MIKQVALYADAAGTLEVDTDASGSTAVLRGPNAEIAGGQVAGSELKSTGILTLKGTAAPVTTTAMADGTATMIELDATSAAFVETLPALAGVYGRLYIFKRMNSGANLPTIKGNGSENIDGANTYVGLTTQYAVVALFASPAGHWNVVWKL